MKKSKLVLLGIFVLALNLIWEFSHYRLYIDLTGIPSTAHLIIASFTDLLLITFIFAVISIFRKKINWIENPKKADYFFVVLLGILIAVGIEFYSLSKGRWAYTESMPAIFGIGRSPLFQLFTTSIISLWLTRFFTRNIIKHRRQYAIISILC